MRINDYMRTGGLRMGERAIKLTHEIDASVAMTEGLRKTGGMDERRRTNPAVLAHPAHPAALCVLYPGVAGRASTRIHRAAGMNEQRGEDR